MVFPIILATNNCGVLGNAYTSWTLGVPEHQLSTHQECYGAQAFSPADLRCPHPIQRRDLNDQGLTETALQMDPSVLLPAAITELDPVWKGCILLPLVLGRDPPRALEPAKASPVAAQSVPYPHSLPKVQRPDPTSSSLPTEDEPLSAGRSTADIAATRFQSCRASVRASLGHVRTSQRQQNHSLRSPLALYPRLSAQISGRGM